MRDRNRRRPSPGLIVAVIALVIALVGSAAALPGRNSVNSGDIRDNTVKRKDQKQNQRTDWAKILFNSPNATILESSPGVSLGSSGNTFAYVDFGHSVAGRPLSATSEWPNDGPINAILCGGGNCFGDPPSDDTSHVYVEEDAGATVYLTVLPK